MTSWSSSATTDRYPGPVFVLVCAVLLVAALWFESSLPDEPQPPTGVEVAE